jgi:hypothetical protein
MAFVSYGFVLVRLNSTAAGGANSAGVTREHYGYFGPLARANTQVFHLVYDDDQHLPSGIHPAKVAIVTTVAVFVALFVPKIQIFLIFISGFSKAFPEGFGRQPLA